MKALLLCGILASVLASADQRFFGWRFAPTPADLATPWTAPTGYVRAKPGDIKSLPFAAATSVMNDQTQYEPGWHRAPSLDDSIPDNSQADAFAATIQTQWAAMPKPSPSPSASPSPSPSPTVGPSLLSFSVDGSRKPTLAAPVTLVATVTVGLSRNETTGQVAQMPAGAACQPLSTPAAFTAAGITLSFFTAQQITTTTASVAGLPVGAYYDALLPTSQVCGGDLLWIDVAAAGPLPGPAAKPGIYSGTIAGATLSVQVWNPTMAALPTEPVYVGAGPFAELLGHNLSRNTSVGPEAALDIQYINALRAHRMEPFGQAVSNPPVVTAVTGTPAHLDFDQFSALGGSYRQLALTGRLADPVLGFFTNNLPAVTAAYMQALEATLVTEGLKGKVWTYLYDEPPASTYAGIATAAALIKANAPDLKIMVTTEPNATLTNAVVDYFTPIFDAFLQPGHPQIASYNPAYFLYGSCVSHACGNHTTPGSPDLMIDQESVHALAYVVAPWKLGAKSTLYYNSVEQYGRDANDNQVLAGVTPVDPWVSQYLFGGNGDGTLFYPGRAGERGFVTDTPVVSIRMKNLRDGSYMVEYLALAKAAAIAAGGSLVTSITAWDHSWANWMAARKAIGQSL